jgi:hypothetical protein
MHAAISTSLLRLCATALCVVVLPTGSACAATIDDGLDGMAMPENAVPLLAQGPARVATLLGFALNGVCVLRRERCAHRG